MDHAIYGTQPLGTIGDGEADAQDHARRRQPLDRQGCGADNGVLVVVGDLDPAQAFDAAAAELGGWGAARPVAPPDDPRA